MGFLNNNEGIGIDMDNQFLQLRNLLLLHRRKHNLGGLTAVRTLTVQIGSTTTQLLVNSFLFLFFMPRITANKIISAISNDTNSKCCHDKKPSGCL